MAKLALELGPMAKHWLENEPNDSLVNRVIDWIENVLCDTDADVQHDHATIPIRLPHTGHQLYVAEVPDTDVGVTFLEAAPFRTMVVVLIEQISEALGDL